VAQHLADVHQRRPLGEHLARERVPQAVRPDMRDRGPPARSLHHVADESRPDRSRRPAQSPERDRQMLRAAIGSDRVAVMGDLFHMNTKSET